MLKCNELIIISNNNIVIQISSFCFLFLISNNVNVKRYNSHKLKQSFKTCKGLLRTKSKNFHPKPFPIYHYTT